MMNILVLYGRHEAPAIQEIYFNNPFKKLEERGLINFNLIELDKLKIDEINEYHLIVISRIFEERIIGLIDFCKKKNKKIDKNIDNNFQLPSPPK